MADDKQKGAKTVTVDAEHYRSLVLAKLRAEIDSKRAAYKLATHIDPASIAGMGYWKMKYWKMKYWKMGATIEMGDEVINPAIVQREQK
ncbi:hypothetical protein LJR225_001374 [Phenylobacterium sp. LjRoot225]|uniref:hypothetical protein n=1 Tax=Phenylobacterium sp. LjRoot225 TaxID=3342285 RepID=UPI003ECDDD12